jgi:hypothetical protein
MVIGLQICRASSLIIIIIIIKGFRFLGKKYWRLSVPAVFDVAFTLVMTESLASAVKIKRDHTRKYITCLIEAVYMKQMTSREVERV